MNTILFITRTIKKLSTKQLAKILQIEEGEYIELEHSIGDITASHALKLAKLYGLDAEIFLYYNGQDQRLLKFAMDEVSQIVRTIKVDDIPQRHYFQLITLGNTALSLQAELGNALYRQYELEMDNKALRRLLTDYKSQLDKNESSK